MTERIEQDIHELPLADIGYQRLEPRQVLSASFMLVGGELILDGFDPNQDVTLSQENAFINGASRDAYVFELANGSWTGTSSPLVEVESSGTGTNNRLEVATSNFGGAALGRISLDGQTANGSSIQLFQNSSQVQIETLTVSNIQNVDQSLSLRTQGDVLASNLSIIDSNPSDLLTVAADISLETNGSLIVTGLIENQMQDASADVLLTATGINGDVELLADVSTAQGSVTIVADDSVLIRPAVEVSAQSNGDVSIIGGADGLVGDSGDIVRMDDGSSVRVNTGIARLITSTGSDIFLSEVVSQNTNNAILIDSGNDIFDNTAAEDANLVAQQGRIRLISLGDAGQPSAQDLNIDSESLQFDTGGSIFLTDIAGGLNIDAFSRTDGGGQVQTNDFLMITANVDTGDTTRFAAGNSNNENDDLSIIDATIRLNNPVSSTLTFEAGDDIIFDGGQIQTAGFGLAQANHTVNLVADSEGSIDADRGSITNTPGTNFSVVTSELNLSAHQGIGHSLPAISSDFRINVDQLTANNTGTGDINILERDNIELVNIETADGKILVTAGNNIDAVRVVSGETETTEDNRDDVQLISNNGTINVQTVLSADNLLISAVAGNIVDNSTSNIAAESDAVLLARDAIELVDQSNDALRVGGNVSVIATTVSIGEDGEIAGDSVATNVQMGSLTFDANAVTIIEDDATLLTGVNSAENLYLASSQLIENQANTELVVNNHAQLNAPAIRIGEQTNDNIQLGTIGVVADNAYLGLNSSVEINGRAPDTLPSQFGTVASHGTAVTQTLFIDSTSSVVQNVGSLNANEIGIRSGEHVHLANVAVTNSVIAIDSVTAADLTDAGLINSLNQLSAVENSEVRILPQSIAINHEGQLNIDTVSAPLVPGSIPATDVVGFAASNGSILATANDEILLNQNVIASSNRADPQVTIYSRSGSTTAPAIEFLGGDLIVNGPTNQGLVNAVQTTATFFDSEGFVFRGTTELLVLNPDGSANQDIVLEYGHAGETGYRVGIVWDDQNQPGAPVEVINTYVADPNVATEAYDDRLYTDNPSTLLQLGGNEGGRETVSKVGAYSKDNIIAHSDQPNVFSTITVRNDQDVNLFSGSLDSSSDEFNANALNEVSQTLKAELDSPKRFAPNLPSINEINPIETKPTIDFPLTSNSPETSTSFVFSRNVQPFESGDLKWVQVDVPIIELEEVGDEIRLKDPTKIFSPTKDADVNDLDDEIGENEVEKIIQEIETDQEAESGYWYKVFKDYENRDDELFFYHYKTGEQTDSADTNEELDPEKSPDTVKSERSPESQEKSQPEYPDSDFEDSPGRESDFQPLEIENESTSDQSDTPPTRSSTLTAGCLLLAAQWLQKNKNPIADKNTTGTRKASDKPATAKAPESSVEPETPKQPIKFGRLARLKRKIRKA
jgi:hypothetical protein